VETDTISPPPPGPQYISGPDSICIYESGVYSANLPIACPAQWYIDGILQVNDTLNEIEIVWAAAGNHMILLQADCDSTNTILDSMSVFVRDVAQQPSPIVGNNAVCVFDTEIYSTMINDDEICQWYINDSVLFDTVNEISIDWNNVGAQILKVNAVNQCGPGDTVSLGVSVMSAPEVFLGNDTTIFENDTLVLNAQNYNSFYQWSTGDTLPAIKVFNSGIYWVDVNNLCGFSSDTIIVDVVVGIYENLKSTIRYYLRNSTVFVDIPDKDIMKTQVFDINGRLTFEDSHNNKITLNSKGLKLMRLQTTKKEYIIKLIN
jgi:hypothetical protein